ncbi:MAG TPA: HisA/HisF-related TIM barrel protein [Gemmatales bacterium]|nr:HisA/HisF-related TIM barrel protein [Gemmatales bacterium]
MSLPASVLPVIDLMGGQVVHARAGLRSQYQPLISTWCQEAHDPFRLMDVLHQQLGLSEYYLADLDALEGRDPQQDLIANLIELGYQLWMDAAIQSTSEAGYWLTQGVDRVIVAGESLSSFSCLQRMFDGNLQDRVVFSLDLMEGRLRSRLGVFPDMEPLTVVGKVAELGCRHFIVLDAAAVGVSHGPSTLSLCTQIRERYPCCTLISGGGVRNKVDITVMEEAGVDRVLVSTWLHQGCP